MLILHQFPNQSYQIVINKQQTTILIINDQLMKFTKVSSSLTSLRQATKLSASLDKQNQPLNLTQQTLDLPKPSTKLGLEIRKKIQKASNDIQQKIPLTQSNIYNLPNCPMSRSESVESLGDNISKNVSFGQTDRCSLNSLSRQSSKKSILKKSVSGAKRSGSLQKSQVSMANSHVDYQDQSVDYSIGNKVVMDRYQSLQRELRNEGKQYRDTVYPPVQASIYLNNSLMKQFCEMFEKEGRSIEWMRLSELYRPEDLVVWTSEKSQKSCIQKGYISRAGGDGDFLATVLNAMREKNSLLQKMFQSQVVNGQCIYYVKIHQTQTNVWKYVVLDDYIPVIVNKKLGQSERYLPVNVHPAFLNVGAVGGKMQIWPFLLQKALAKYYSNYDSLGNGNTLDFMEEVASVFLESLKIKENLDRVGKIMRNEDSLMLGLDKKGCLHPLKTLRFQNSQRQYVFLDREQGYIQKSLNTEQFLSKFSTLYYSQLHKYHYTFRCQIQQQNTRARLQSKKHQYILREFVVQQPCECQVGTVQKEQRFYRSYLTYEYAWMRVILLQKQQHSYRWIGAAYTNGKTTKITASLTPGEYVVVLMPEWGQRAYDFNLLFRGDVQVLMQRKPYELYRNIVEEGCMDLAQRYGRMVQVNKNICSYNYIDRNIGLIIENVNNEKESGSVRIMRSIVGLAEYNIRPINAEFVDKNNVEISIAKRSHFTVVLMTYRGVEKGFLDSFDFGF